MRGKVRVIGGRWRSRRLDVLDTPGLRPTPDRVRETLFNWLSPHIAGADCLDLYAGTGVLGIEALSRGAASVVMVEHNRELVSHLEKQAQKLETRDLSVVCSDVSDWLIRCQQSFDVVFIDPPYQSGLLDSTVDSLISCGCLNKASLLYVESDRNIEIGNERIHVVKSGEAGSVHYQLLSLE